MFRKLKFWGLTALVLIFLLLFANAANAQFGTPFGGRILTVTACDSGFWITVGPPVPGSIMIVPGTIIFPHRVFRIGAWVLGTTPFGPIAQVPCVVGIVPVGSGYPASVIGTSF